MIKFSILVRAETGDEVLLGEESAVITAPGLVFYDDEAGEYLGTVLRALTHQVAGKVKSKLILDPNEKNKVFLFRNVASMLLKLDGEDKKDFLGHLKKLFEEFKDDPE